MFKIRIAPLIGILLIVFIGFASASIPKLGENNGNIPKLDYEDAGFCINIYNNMTNSSAYWDDLDDINLTQMEDNGGTLNILESWVSSLAGVNASWNETYADTLYRADDWDNITGIPHATPSNGDTAHFSLADEIYDWVIGLAYATESYVNNLLTGYYNQTDIEGFGYYNATDFSISNYYLTSNPSNYWNDTFATFNKTYGDTLYVDADGDSMTGILNHTAVSGITRWINQTANIGECNNGTHVIIGNLTGVTGC